MSKIINFPTKVPNNKEELLARVIYLRNYISAQIVDLAKARETLKKVEKRLKEVKAKQNIRLIKG